MILSSLASIADRRASTPAAPFVAEEDGAARWGMAGAAAAARGMTGGGDAAFGSGFFHDGAAAGAGAGLGFARLRPPAPPRRGALLAAASRVAAQVISIEAAAAAAPAARHHRAQLARDAAAASSGGCPRAAAASGNNLARGASFGRRADLLERLAFLDVAQQPAHAAARWHLRPRGRDGRRGSNSGGLRRGGPRRRLGRRLRGLGLVPRRLLPALVVVVPLALVRLEGLPAGEEVLVGHRVGVERFDAWRGFCYFCWRAALQQNAARQIYGWASNNLLHAATALRARAASTASLAASALK